MSKPPVCNILRQAQDDRCINQDERCINQDDKCINQEDKCIKKETALIIQSGLSSILKVQAKYLSLRRKPLQQPLSRLRSLLDVGEWH